MRSWSDGQKFIFEEIVIYTLVLLCALLSDYLANLLYAFDLLAMPQPYSFGVLQIGISFTFGALLLRKLDHARYYF